MFSPTVKIHSEWIDGTLKGWAGV